MLATFSFFAFLTLSSVSANPRQCYNCGYKRDNNATETHEIGDLPFCGDFANPMDNLVNCTAEVDCCAVMKEYFEILNEHTNETLYQVVARHGCESDLDNFPNHEHRPYCSEYNNKCYEYEDSTLPNATDSVTITKIETCFCDSDRWRNKNLYFTLQVINGCVRCNVADPIFTPDTTPGTQTTTITSGANELFVTVLTLALATPVSRHI